MTLTPSRRAVLAALAASSLPGGAAAALPDDATLAAARTRIAALERRAGGRLGVAIVDTGTGRRIGYRETERFPMCSTFKLLAAAAVLQRVDAGRDRLDRAVAYGASDMLDYAPVTREHLADGQMQLGALCAAALQWSDNTAGNLLLAAIGGPAGVTGFARSIGDTVTRLDRTEPTLNGAVPGDERDTTSPAAMAGDLDAVLLGAALSVGSRRQLLDWLLADKVAGKRLRAGLPATWRIADKTGSGDLSTTNTVGLLLPPDRPPIIATVYHTQSPAGTDARNAVHADIARLIVDVLSEG